MVRLASGRSRVQADHGHGAKGPLKRALAFAALLAACSRSPERPAPERLAFIAFDNLTPDSALDWIATAAPAVLAHELTLQDGPAPSFAATVREAYGQGATRMAHGYFEKRGPDLWFHLVIEDASSHKIVRETSARGPALEALASLARSVDPHAQAFETSRADAFAAWGRGDFERAVALDPDFGIAWLNWAESLAARGDSAGAQAVAARALMHPLPNFPAERLRIQALDAALRHDESGRLQALEGLAELSPLDPAALRALAEAELSSRRFAQAERAYERLSRAAPDDPTTDNMLGYTQALAGEPDKARASLERYARRPGQAANALDSLGEAMFMNGRFAEAEKAFLECYQKYPGFLNGAPLWKAAHARWLAGNLKGADELLDRYLTQVRSDDSLASWRRATWLYETGRREEAIALLRKAPENDLIRRQFATWDHPDAALPRDPDALRRLYETTGPVNDGLVRISYAKALLEAGRDEEARALLRRWPLPPQADLPAESLVLPEFLTLKKKLS